MSAELTNVLSWLRLGVGGLLIAFGALMLLGGAIGTLRLPDFYTRLHALGAGSVVGGVLVALGLGCAAPSTDIALRLFMLAVLLAVIAPGLHYMMANAAHVSGLAPIAGKSARQRSDAS